MVWVCPSELPVIGKLEAIITSPSVEIAGALATVLAPALGLGEEAAVEVVGEEVVEVEVVVPAQPTHKESKLSTTAERLNEAIMGEYLIFKFCI
jgi:hypothetical protein